MSGRLGRALLVAVGLLMVLGWTRVLGTSVLVFLAAGVGLALLVATAAWLIMTRSGDLQAWLKHRLWAREAGRHHAFGGVSLQLEDDGRHAWLAAAGLQRVLGHREPEAVLAARHAGRSRRGTDGTLMLRVDAVVHHLATMPGRDQPRVQRLRRYLEREVLYPASRRHMR